MVNFFQTKAEDDDEIEETGRTNEIEEAEIEEDGKQ